MPVKRASELINIKILSIPNCCPKKPRGDKNKAPIPQLNPCITPLMTPVYFGIAFCPWTSKMPTESIMKNPVKINALIAMILFVFMKYKNNKIKGKIVTKDSVITPFEPILFSNFEL